MYTPGDVYPCLCCAMALVRRLMTPRHVVVYPVVHASPLLLPRCPTPCAARRHEVLRNWFLSLVQSANKVAHTVLLNLVRT